MRWFQQEAVEIYLAAHLSMYPCRASIWSQTNIIFGRLRHPRRVCYVNGCYILLLDKWRANIFHLCNIISVATSGRKLQNNRKQNCSSECRRFADSKNFSFEDNQIIQLCVYICVCSKPSQATIIIVLKWNECSPWHYLHRVFLCIYRKGRKKSDWRLILLICNSAKPFLHDFHGFMVIIENKWGVTFLQEFASFHKIVLFVFLFSCWSQLDTCCLLEFFGAQGRKKCCDKEKTTRDESTTL